MQIFDMDGTLIDSNGIWKDVDTAFLAKRGLPYTRAYYEGVAHTIFPLAAKFTKEFCHLPESEEAIMAEWMDMAGDLYGTSVPVKPGVRAYLEKLRDAGERLMVVTSWIRRLLPRFSMKISTVSYSPAVSAEERSSMTCAVLIMRCK